MYVAISEVDMKATSLPYMYPRQQTDDVWLPKNKLRVRNAFGCHNQDCHLG